MQVGRYIRTPEIRAKMSASQKGKTGKLGNAWKGDKVGYHGVHFWVKQTLGSPSECENCGTRDSYRFEWANLSGEYRRVISDWARLCVRCHRLIDNNGKKAAIARAENKLQLIRREV